MQIHCMGNFPAIRPAAVKFGANAVPVTMDEAKALQKKMPSLLLGRPENSHMDLYQSQFKVNAIGISKVGSDYSVSIMTETRAGRHAVLKALSKMPGYQPKVSGSPVGSLSNGDAAVSIESGGKQIPVVVRYGGRIVAA